MQQLDSRAAPVFKKLNGSPPDQLDTEERSTLSVFIRGMTYRSPAMFEALKQTGQREWWKIVDEIEAEYEQRKTPCDPPSYEGFRANLTADRIESSVLDTLPHIFASIDVGQILNNLHARTIVIPESVPEFLISDDPLARTNGILVKNGHFALPISPRRLLVLAWKLETLNLITSQKPKELVTNVNRWVVESARLFVGASDRSQDRFIRNWFGRDPKPPISR